MITSILSLGEQVFLNISGVLDEILNLIESVSEGFPSYSQLSQDPQDISWKKGQHQKTPS